MPKVEIIAAEIGHVYRLAKNLRDLDRREFTCAGLDPRRALRKAFRDSIIARTGFVDGEIAAMFGVGGTIMGGEGRIWLLTTPAVERVPVTFVREARRELDRLLPLFPVLHGVVQTSYHQAVAFLILLGFSLGEAFRLGPDGALFQRFFMVRHGH